MKNKTLWDQISPEKQSKIKNKASSYPGIYGTLSEKLKSTDNKYELSLLEYADLCLCLGGYLGELFNPNQIFTE